MTELSEIDPQLVAVRDRQSGRNLLDPSDPDPLRVDVSAGRAVRVALEVENGREGLIDLTVASDDLWLTAETSRLTLVGGERGELILAVGPQGDSQFANLIFTWPGLHRAHSLSVMVMRQTRRAAVADTYRAEISRENRTCFLFLVDRSASMLKPFAGQEGRTKAQCVADALNRLLQELVARCSKGPEILDRYDIGVIGYGDVAVAPALGGALAGRRLVPVSQIREHPLRVETRTRKVSDGCGGLVETTVKIPVWYEPFGNGKTPMAQALTVAHGVIEDFLRSHPKCFPPTVINITDGEATDADPQPRAAALRSLASEDGHVLLFNLHVSSSDVTSIQYPASEGGLPDKFSRCLFRMSSRIPPRMLNQARSVVPGIADGARGFVFNADMVATVQMLDIGTQHTKR